MAGDFDFERVQEDSEFELGGTFDPERRRVVVVRFPGEPAEGVELRLAHELAHALEFQHFEELSGDALRGERAFAGRALVEGSATFVHLRYGRRYLGAGRVSPEVLSPLGPANLGAAVPPALAATFRFPYSAGATFVRGLYTRREDWSLVNRAFESPPLTTEHVLHPGAFLRDDRPEPVDLRARDVLGSDWRRVGGDQAGEFDALTVLALGAPSEAARAAANGWDGGRYEIWELPPADGRCPPPCRGRTAGIIGFRWERAVDVAEFATAADQYLSLSLFAEPADPLMWRIDDGFATFAVGDRSSALAYAPSAGLARELAKAAAG